MFKKLLLIALCSVSFINATEDLSQTTTQSENWFVLTGRQRQEARVAGLSTLKDKINNITKEDVKKAAVLSAAIGSKYVILSVANDNNEDQLAFYCLGALVVDGVASNYYKVHPLSNLALNVVGATLMSPQKNILDKVRFGIEQGTVCLALSFSLRGWLIIITEVFKKVSF